MTITDPIKVELRVVPDVQAPPMRPKRGRRARAPDAEGRRERAARAARDQGSAPLWLAPAASRAAAAVEADFRGRREY